MLRRNSTRTPRAIFRRRIRTGRASFRKTGTDARQEGQTMRTQSFTMNSHSAEASMTITVLSWLLRIIAAAILLQTLFFKFTAAPESVYIFTKVGAEPWGRIGSGIVELIAAILLLAPRFTWLGSLLAVGVMSGAILSHLTILGIE